MTDYAELNLGAGGIKASMDDLGAMKVQRVKVQTGVDGAAADVNDTNPMPVAEFKQLVLEGRVPGYSIMATMGEMESAGTTATGEDVWRGTDAGGPVVQPLPLDAGEQMSVVSSSANDAAAGTGIQKVEVHYLDETGAAGSEIVTLNGTTPVNLAYATVRYVQSMHATEVGSNGVAAGHVSIYKTSGAIATDLYNLIAANGNASLVPSRMVPLGKTLYLREIHFEEAQGKRCAFRVRSTDADGVLIPRVFVFKGGTYIKQSATGMITMGMEVPALSVIKVTAFPDTAGADGSTCWWGYLVDD